MRNNPSEPGTFILHLTGAYQKLLVVGFALTPLIAIAYLHVYQNPRLNFESHSFHEAAIGVAIALSSFATYVTWRCYLASGEVFLRWLTLGFLGFTLIYLPHGVLTFRMQEDPILFLIFGPASRLVMAGCFFIALLRNGRPVDPPASRHPRKFWIGGIACFLLIILTTASVNLIPASSAMNILKALEICALALCVAGILVMAWQRSRSPLMAVYMISLAAFAQSSLSFLLANAWNHQWWLAHAIFSAGFFLLSYGIVQAFRTTHSFSAVYSQIEMMERLREEQARTREAMLQLQAANTRLAQLATTDSLTGVSNRRLLMERARIEISRAQRNGAPLSLLCLDLDHFKRINDCHGHQAGDAVLINVAAEIQRMLRPADLVARVGGEEFHILLPDADRARAREIAERIRSALEGLAIQVEDGIVQVTASIGCAQHGPDGDDMTSLIRSGDERLYEAKARGRNRVVATHDRPAHQDVH
ncbi:MAG: GGDEF domain-containing protein [Rhizobium sp.]|nr:GGDEF domain-containing protein [Rhizobium sp.]